MNAVFEVKASIHKERIKKMPRHRLLFLLIFFTLTYSMGSTNAVLSAKTKNRTASLVNLSFSFSIVNDHSELIINANGPIGDINSFRLESPNRLVVDVVNADLPQGKVKIAVDREELKAIRIARHEGKVRFVFDLSQDKPIHYNLERSPEGVKITVELEGREDSIGLLSEKEEATKFSSQSPGLEVISQPELRPQQVGTPYPAVKRCVGNKVSIKLLKADIRDFFSCISESSGVDIEVAPDIRTQVTLRFTDMPWGQALDTIIKFYGLKLEKRNNGYYVSSNSL